MDVKPELSGALRRFQIIAWVVSVLLVILMFVAVPLRIFAGIPTLSAIVSPIHGFGYMVYLVLAFDLARRADWVLWPRTVLLLLSGTVPVWSFINERRVTHLLTREAGKTSQPTPVGK